jgi:hypothetical protein
LIDLECRICARSSGDDHQSKHDSDHPLRHVPPPLRVGLTQSPIGRLMHDNGSVMSTARRRPAASNAPPIEAQGLLRGVAGSFTSRGKQASGTTQSPTLTRTEPAPLRREQPFVFHGQRQDSRYPLRAAVRQQISLVAQSHRSMSAVRQGRQQQA